MWLIRKYRIGKFREICEFNILIQKFHRAKLFLLLLNVVKKMKLQLSAEKTQLQVSSLKKPNVLK